MYGSFLRYSTAPNKNQVTTQAIANALETGDPSGSTGEQYSMWEYSYAAQNGDRTMWDGTESLVRMVSNTDKYQNDEKCETGRG